MRTSSVIFTWPDAVQGQLSVSATTGELRGIQGVEPVLRLTFNVETGTLALDWGYLDARSQLAALAP